MMRRSSRPCCTTPSKTPSASYRAVAEWFGVRYRKLVDGVTKLTNLAAQPAETKQAENFRKLFMAMSKDLRVILVKLADRSAQHAHDQIDAPEKQVQKARETMDIFAPLAGAWACNGCAKSLKICVSCSQP